MKMNRIILLLSLLLIACIPCKSQRFRAGIIAGAAITDVDGSDLIDGDNDFHKFGAIIGGLVNTKLSSRSILQMEIYYAMKGSTQSPILDSLTGTYQNYYSLVLDYIDVSLLWKYSLKVFINKWTTDKYGIELGATLGTLIASSYSVNSVDYSITTNTSSYGVLQVNPIDLEVFGGIYYNITPKFFFDVRYSNSIIPVIPHYNSVQNFYPYYNDYNLGNSLSFELRLGYVFGASAESSSTNTYEKSNP
jgi:hypothetical protein